MNSISLVGNLGRDPQMSEFNGNPKASFSLAVKRPFTRDKTDWFFVTVFRKSAEACGKYLRKGSLVAVTGRMESYKSGDAQKYVVVAENVDFLDKASGESQQQSEGGQQQYQPPPAPAPAPAPQQQYREGPPPHDDDDDPFGDD